MAERWEMVQYIFPDPSNGRALRSAIAQLALSWAERSLAGAQVDHSLSKGWRYVTVPKAIEGELRGILTALGVEVDE